MALMYLVNKPYVFDRLTRWLLLFLKYDFKIIDKFDRSHLMVDALSQLPNNFEHVGIPDQTNGAHMFTLQPKWL
jgi:hypothetical protein